MATTVRDQIAASLLVSANSMGVGLGEIAVRRADMYLGDIDRRYNKAFQQAGPELTAPILVERKDTGGDVVVMNKKREGLLVLAGVEIILAEDLSFSRTRTTDFQTSMFTATPIKLRWDGADLPGLRLKPRKAGESFALGFPLILGRGDPSVPAALRDKVIAAFG
jgi:hypothetical protein